MSDNNINHLKNTHEGNIVDKDNYITVLVVVKLILYLSVQRYIKKERKKKANIHVRYTYCIPNFSLAHCIFFLTTLTQDVISLLVYVFNINRPFYKTKPNPIYRNSSITQ